MAESLAYQVVRGIRENRCIVILTQNVEARGLICAALSRFRQPPDSFHCLVTVPSWDPVGGQYWFDIHKTIAEMAGHPHRELSEHPHHQR
eukprot:1236425-Heterocapsa_arctica.AAC.1